MVVRVKENGQHPNKILKSKEKSNFNMYLGKVRKKTVQRKLMIRSRRSTTLLCRPGLGGGFSVGTKGVSISARGCTTSLFLFGGPCERSTPCLRPSEYPIFRTTEIHFAHCSHKYFSLFLHFLRGQKLLEGFCRDSSDSSICALPISWPLNNSLLSFLEHVSLFCTHN